VLPAVSSIAVAQAYPSRPIRLIIGYTPGGSADLDARLMGQWLSERPARSPAPVPIATSAPLPVPTASPAPPDLIPTPIMTGLPSVAPIAGAKLPVLPPPAQSSDARR
jgi:hypothetical protein